VLRLMREASLSVKPHLRLKAKHTPTGNKPKPPRPNGWWGIDMTKVLAEGLGWVYVVLVLDWYTKKIVGYYAGMRCITQHWLATLDMAVNPQFRTGPKARDSRR
jgi:putative transposase